MTYFAYGSNMDREQMARRCPGAKLIGAARLPGYRLDFTILKSAAGRFGFPRGYRRMRQNMET